MFAQASPAHYLVIGSKTSDTFLLGHLIPSSKPVLYSTTGSTKPRAIGNFLLRYLFIYLFLKCTYSLTQELHKNCSLIQLKPKPSGRQKSHCSPWKNNLIADFPLHLDSKQLSVGQAEIQSLQRTETPSTSLWEQPPSTTQTEADDPSGGSGRIFASAWQLKLVVLSKLFYIWRKDQEKKTGASRFRALGAKSPIIDLSGLFCHGYFFSKCQNPE